MLGTITCVNERGFGFIKVAGQKDVFFHAKQLRNLEFSDRLKFMDVEFEVETVDSKVRAVDVRAAR